MSSPAVTLSGKIRDISGNAIAGTVTAILGNYGANAPIISGDSELAPIAVIATANGSGVWSMSLWGSDQISPKNTTYTITITPANSNAAIWIEEYLITSGSYDLSNLIPLIVTPPIYIQPAVGPTGPQGPAGSPGGSYASSFSNVTTTTVSGITHGLATADLSVSVYDSSTGTRNQIIPNSVSIDSSSFDVTVTFGGTQSGRIVISV